MEMASNILNYFMYLITYIVIDELSTTFVFSTKYIDAIHSHSYIKLIQRKFNLYSYMFFDLTIVKRSQVV